MISETSTHTIGLILSIAKNSFTTALMNLFEEKLSQRDYQLLIGLTNHSIEKERFYLETFGKTTDGIFILSDSKDYKELADAVPASVPTIFLHRAPSDCQQTAILENDYSATFQAILSMIHSGHPKVALICRNIQFSTNREIIRAYQTAMDTMPEGFRGDWIFECIDTEGDYLENLIEKVVQKGCTGFLASSVEVTECLAPYLYNYNHSHDTSLLLTGFSTEGFNSFLASSLDTVTRPVKRIVDLAIQQMFYQLSQPNPIHNSFHVKGVFQTRDNNSFQG